MEVLCTNVRHQSRGGEPTAFVGWFIERRRLDMISSDHSPSPLDLKHVDSGDFIKAWGGISGLQLSLPLTWTKGKERGMTLSQFAGENKFYSAFCFSFCSFRFVFTSCEKGRETRDTVIDTHQ
jgi:hypothetical protein